jgi:hypothetical protein
MEVAYDACDVYEQVDRIRETIVKERLTPPVMVSHSRSSYLGLKFLESYALSGLIMINPQLKRLNNFRVDSVSRILSDIYKVDEISDEYYQDWLVSPGADTISVNYCNLFADPVELERGICAGTASK